MKNLIAFLVAVSAVAQTTASISGRVTDPSGAPVPEARVLLTERGTHVRRSASTSSDGRYSFPSIPVGAYVIEAEAEGLGSAEPAAVAVGGPVTQDLPVTVARVSTQVQVTAAAIAQTVDEQSKSLDILDAVQLDRRAEYSVAEALRTVPGIKVQQLGGPGSFSRIFTRGLRPTDTSILIDGFRFRDAASPQGDASAFIADLLTTNIERVEVLRGSGSSLYGTHATGGVINIIGAQGGGEPRGSLAVEGGGLGLVRPSANVAGGAFANRLHYSLGATHLNVTEGVDGNDRTRNSALHAGGQWQLGPSSVLTGRVLVANTFTQLNDSPFAVGTMPQGRTVRAIPFRTFTPSPDDPDSRRAGNTVSTMVALSHAFSPRVSARFSYAGVGTRRDNRDGPAGTRFEPMFNESNRFDARIDTAQARTDVQLTRNHVLTAGYEFERESFDNHSTNEAPTSAVDARVKIDQSSHAGFAQAQGRYLDGRLQVLVSGRLQKFDLSRPLFSGNSPLYSSLRLPNPPNARTGDVSLAYTVARSSTKFRAHAGNGYRAPSLYERFGASFYAGLFSAYGDPALAPERVLAFDAGVDQYLFGSRARVSATYFYTRIQEAIIFDFTGAIVPDTDPYNRWGGYRNSRGGLARGLEFSVETNPTRTLVVQGSYTYTNANDRVSPYANGYLRSIRISPHMATAVVTQRIGRRFDVAFDLFAASRHLVPFSGHAMAFDGPVKADIVASYTLPVSDRHKVRLYTRVENMLNRTYYEEGFRTPKAWAVGGLKWMF